MGVTLRFRRLEPFGVEVLHDLARPLAPSEAFHFAELVRTHALVLARGQDLTMERQREICALLGPILLREGESGTMSNEGGGPAASALSWHADAAYTDYPFDALSLHALDVVEGGSSTRFVHAADAAERLPEELRALLAGARQEMIAPHYSRLGERTCDTRDPVAQKSGVMPALFRHPRTGRTCVWVSELQTARLIDRDREEGRAALHRTFDVLYDDRFVFEHVWRNGDLIVWDNIALQHARGNLENSGRRVLQRVIVGTHGVAPHVPT